MTKDMRMYIVKGFRNACHEGTEQAWKNYIKKMEKVAKQVNAIDVSTMVDWALRVTMEEEQYA